ncbi:DUF7115 domain-containing protein [Halorarius litoreus]|uniref:DUF7115 domain-containing protein n=1 Tax=Halorarius litoreus TaxID=2962676 RepID=UPI0020CB8825|nr:hypothetical protein [Halorarius litoreus]
MDVPPLVRERLDGESVLTRVPLGGDDAVFVTPTRTLVYRAEGLLSDESVAAYPHDVERLDVSQGRRKSTFTLSYVDTSGKFTVPADRTDDVLAPVFGGVLAAAGITDDGERVRDVYRFSELTLAVTDGHLVKHVGNVFWDDDYELYDFDDVTGIDAEEGSVATQLVVELDSRPHRVKVPSEQAAVVRRTLQSAVFAHHDVDSIEALREKQGVVDEPAVDRKAAFEESGIEPLVDDSQKSDPDAGSDADSNASGVEEPEEPDTPIDRVGDTADPGVAEPAAGDLDEVLERLNALETAVDRQNELIERQQETIQTLVAELRRGR